MNVKTLKQKYAGRVAAADKYRKDKLNQVFREICAEYGWPEDAFVFVERYRDALPCSGTCGWEKQEYSEWKHKYSISWTEGGAVLKPIAKSLGDLLISLGFPSGS